MLKRDITFFMQKNGYTEDFALNLIFIGKNKMRQIALKYKQEDIALPVLSFPYLDDPHIQDKILGEVFVCFPQAVLLAAERNKRVDEMILSLVKHGIENIIQ